MYSKVFFKRGFTLIELLMVMAIMGVVTAITLPVSVDYLTRNNLDVAQTTFAQSVRRAQQLSMSGERDSQWGVIATSGSIVIFKGATYATRDTTMDEVYDMSTGIVVSGQAEYDFAKVTGKPTQTGTLTLTDDNYFKTVGVNAKGVVNY